MENIELRPTHAEGEVVVDVDNWNDVEFDAENVPSSIVEV